MVEEKKVQQKFVEKCKKKEKKKKKMYATKTVKVGGMFGYLTY